jgi:hypothetical protein
MKSAPFKIFNKVSMEIYNKIIVKSYNRILGDWEIMETSERSPAWMLLAARALCLAGLSQ